MESKTSPKKIPTNEEGIFYKSIINENGKEIDKTYIITQLSHIENHKFPI
ncbi:hypothetical protein [Aliarcobacter butzleri]|nr:hypothetical protein [Aliarcobacter butzleri]